MDKKTFVAALAILFVFVSSTVIVQGIREARANPSWGWFSGVVPAEPNKDKPILVIESPQNYSICNGGNVTLSFTVIKPSSWNQTVQPFGDCAIGHIKSVNVSLNGVEEFQDYLNADNLNGGNYWNKSYSLDIGGLHLGTNSLSVTVFANAFYIDNNSTDKTVSIYPMNVTEMVYLVCGTSPTSSPSPSQSPTLSPSPFSSTSTSSTPAESPIQSPSASPTQTPIAEPIPAENTNVIPLPGDDSPKIRTYLIGISVTAAVIAIVALVYFKKRRG